MKAKIKIFFCIIFTFFASISYAQDDSRNEHVRKSFFSGKIPAINTIIGLSGGYSSSNRYNYPLVKLNFDIVEGVFSNFSICSVAGISAGYNSDNEVIALGLSIPSISVGYYLNDFLIYAGGGFYQIWYLKSEKSNYISTSACVHSYGYEIKAGLRYDLTDQISLFGEWSLTPHTWIETVKSDGEEWIFANNFCAGVKLSIPWKL